MSQVLLNDFIDAHIKLFVGLLAKLSVVMQDHRGGLTMLHTKVMMMMQAINQVYYLLPFVHRRIRNQKIV